MTLILNMKNVIFVTIIGSMIWCHNVKKADNLYIISKQQQTALRNQNDTLRITNNNKI